MSVYIKNMEMPRGCASCKISRRNGKKMICPFIWKCEWDIHDPMSAGHRLDGCPLLPVPPHGRLIDADALIEDLERQCKAVFRIDAVSPDDYWITRNEAYNEALWKTWVESFDKYLKARLTIIPAEEGE